MAREHPLFSLKWLRSRDPSSCRTEAISKEHAEIRCGGRQWEDLYRRRWQYDKKVRSTHGVNCTGSCSWDVYVKDGIIVSELQRLDYPSPGPDFPDHEPRGCPRGATYSWYTYSPLRLKYPYVRSNLIEFWRSALNAQNDSIDPSVEIELGLVLRTDKLLPFQESRTDYQIITVGVAEHLWKVIDFFFNPFR